MDLNGSDLQSRSEVPEAESKPTWMMKETDWGDLPSPWLWQITYIHIRFEYRFVGSDYPLKKGSRMAFQTSSFQILSWCSIPIGVISIALLISFGWEKFKITQPRGAWRSTPQNRSSRPWYIGYIMVHQLTVDSWWATNATSWVEDTPRSPHFVSINLPSDRPPTCPANFPVAKWQRFSYLNPS